MILSCCLPHGGALHAGNTSTRNVEASTTTTASTRRSKKLSLQLRELSFQLAYSRTLSAPRGRRRRFGVELSVPKWNAVALFF